MNIRKLTWSILTFILFLSTDNVFATTYFIDSAEGDDKNMGTSEMSAWTSLDRVNAARFSPGDRILFKRGMGWSGTLIVSSSGTDLDPIIFGAYGAGDNPVIKRTLPFSAWEPFKTTTHVSQNARIWMGRIPGLSNSWGMVRNGESTPVHIRRQARGAGTDTMEHGYFYSPANSGLFYFRNDSGPPGAVEIGAYAEAVRIDGKHNVIIDGIDVFGPGGKQVSHPGNAKGLNYKAIAITSHSSRITIKNLSISHANSIGIDADPSTSDIVYENLNVHHNGGTGIYMNSDGGRISGCRSYENGRLDNAIGDRGGIGSSAGKNLTIEHNEVFRNGPDDGGADFEVSFVKTGAVRVERNYIHDCLQGCLQIAYGGDGSIVAYNVISGYGTAKGKMSSAGKLSGIRIGGGGGGSTNIRIYNNVIHGGKQGAAGPEAGLFVAPFDNSGLRVMSNIFANNDNKHINIAGGKSAKLENIRFSNNLFWPMKSGIYWKGRHVRTLKYLRDFSSLGKNSLETDPLFSNRSGTFSEAADFELLPGSPAINKGAPLDIARDYGNGSVPYGPLPDIGAFEARGPE